MRRRKIDAFQLAIIVLSLFLVIGTLILGYSVKNSMFDYQPTEDSLIWHIESENFDSLLNSITVISPEKRENEYKEYFSVAKYYEVALFYKASVNENAKEAAEYLLKLADYKEDMGVFEFCAPIIEDQLQIEIPN